MNVYQVWAEDDGEGDARPVSAPGPREAAETWAASRDVSSAEYAIAGGRYEPVVCVRDSGTVSRWRVTGEAVPVYTARPAGAP